MEKVVGVMPFNFFMVLQNFGCATTALGPAAGGAPDFEKVRTDSTEVPKIPPPGDAWLVPRISMHGACTNYPCASNW